MTVYLGKKDNLKYTSIAFLSFIALILILFFFTKRGFFPWFFMISLFLMMIPTYKGMVSKISMDENKIIISRPLSREIINIPHIAFCAVHNIGEGKSTLYVFLRKKKGESYRIKGIKSQKSYEEIMEALSKGGRPEGIQVNFNKAAKVPVALVENGDELEEKILDSVDMHHYNAVYC